MPGVLSQPHGVEVRHHLENRVQGRRGWTRGRPKPRVPGDRRCALLHEGQTRCLHNRSPPGSVCGWAFATCWMKWTCFCGDARQASRFKHQRGWCVVVLFAESHSLGCFVSFVPSVSSNSCRVIRVSHCRRSSTFVKFLTPCVLIGCVDASHLDVWFWSRSAWSHRAASWLLSTTPPDPNYGLVWNDFNTTFGKVYNGIFDKCTCPGLRTQLVLQLSCRQWRWHGVGPWRHHWSCTEESWTPCSRFDIKLHGGCRQRVLVATVSDHSEAYKSSVKVGGVLVSVDGDREFTIHSSVEVRWQADVRMECPSTTCGFSSRAVAPCGVEDSSAIVDEGWNTLTRATIHQRCSLIDEQCFRRLCLAQRDSPFPPQECFNLAPVASPLRSVSSMRLWLNTQGLQKLIAMTARYATNIAWAFGASIKAKVSGRLDVFNQGKQGSDCWKQCPRSQREWGELVSHQRRWFATTECRARANTWLLHETYDRLIRSAESGTLACCRSVLSVTDASEISGRKFVRWHGVTATSLCLNVGILKGEPDDPFRSTADRDRLLRRPSLCLNCPVSPICHHLFHLLPLGWCSTVFVSMCNCLSLCALSVSHLSVVSCLQVTRFAQCFIVVTNCSRVV